MRIINLQNIFKITTLLVVLGLVGCTKPPELPKISVNEAWDQSYNDVIKHVLNCKECSKSFKEYSTMDIFTEDLYTGKFSKCPEYMSIYKRSTTFEDWQLFPMGWQWKGPTQEKFTWDYEKQKWQRK